MAEMFESIVYIFVILSQIQIIESLFVSVGDYSNESILGLNSPECGLSVERIVLRLFLNNTCFQRKYEDKTLVFFDIQNGKYKPKISQRVFKGIDVRNVYESPWAVHLGPIHWFWDARVCSGVLITPYWVLTAAHCFDDIKNHWKAGVILNMGSNKKEGTHKLQVGPDSFFAHPLYSNPPGATDEERKANQIQYDLALMRVKGFIPDTTHDNKYFINTICLPKRDEVNTVSENASFYGYGRINEKHVWPQYLQRGWVMLNPYRTCAPMLCGYYTDELPRTCPGDTGGPLVQFVPGAQNRAVLTGILRGGNRALPFDLPCTNQIEASFWVPVSKHIDWILKTMKENLS